MRERTSGILFGWATRIDCRLAIFCSSGDQLAILNAHSTARSQLTLYNLADGHSRANRKLALIEVCISAVLLSIHTRHKCLRKSAVHL